MDRKTKVVLKALIYDLDEEMANDFDRSTKDTTEKERAFSNGYREALRKAERLIIEYLGE
jgi:hypothetical protein